MFEINRITNVLGFVILRILASIFEESIWTHCKIKNRYPPQTESSNGIHCNFRIETNSLVPNKKKKSHTLTKLFFMIIPISMYVKVNVIEQVFRNRPDIDTELDFAKAIIF